MTDEVRAEWKRLCERFQTRSDLYDRTAERHRRELDLVYHDLVQAGAARDRFRKAHPEVEQES